MGEARRCSARCFCWRRSRTRWAPCLRGRRFPPSPHGVFGPRVRAPFAPWCALSCRRGGPCAWSIVMRLDFIPWLVILVWLGTRPFGRWERWLAVALAGPIIVALLATNAAGLAKVQDELAAMHEADAALAPGWTMLPIM